MLEKVVRMGLLLEFYGPLLTEKQRQMAELYYDQDLSLGEIADESAVSRQAVHDSLQRTEKLLEKYERKLGLAAKYLAYQQELEQCLALVAAALAQAQAGQTVDRESLEAVQAALRGLLAKE